MHPVSQTFITFTLVFFACARQAGDLVCGSTFSACPHVTPEVNHALIFIFEKKARTRSLLGTFLWDDPDDG